MSEETLTGTFRHYKGGMYRVVCVATDTETEEEVVVYESLGGKNDGQKWVRPKIMFEELVAQEAGGFEPRFKKVWD